MAMAEDRESGGGMNWTPVIAFSAAGAIIAIDASGVAAHTNRSNN